jgi:hypothetical protein
MPCNRFDDENTGMEQTSNPEAFELGTEVHRKATQCSVHFTVCVTGAHQSLHSYLNGNDDLVYVYQVLYMIPNTFMNTVH